MIHLIACVIQFTFNFNLFEFGLVSSSYCWLDYHCQKLSVLYEQKIYLVLDLSYGSIKIVIEK